MDAPDLEDPLTQSLIQAFLAQMDKTAMRVSDLSQNTINPMKSK